MGCRIRREKKVKEAKSQNDDIISRQAAIDAIFSEPLYESGMKKRDADAVVPAIYEKIKSLPSTETHEERTETHACDCIERQAAIEAIEEMQMPIMRYMFPEEQFVFKGMSEALSAIKDLPSAQPEQTNSWCINSWCIGCKEYDQERKCCPRYNRVIRQTLDEAYAHGETEAEARFHNEIVWCKDCKYYREYGYVNGKPKFLPKCTFNSIYVNADDFCSRAERRTDDLQ